MPAHYVAAQTRLIGSRTARFGGWTPQCLPDKLGELRGGGDISTQSEGNPLGVRTGTHRSEASPVTERRLATFALEHLRSQVELYPEDFLRVPTADHVRKRRTKANRHRRKPE